MQDDNNNLQQQRSRVAWDSQYSSSPRSRRKGGKIEMLKSSFSQSLLKIMREEAALCSFVFLPVWLPITSRTPPRSQHWETPSFLPLHPISHHPHAPAPLRVAGRASSGDGVGGTVGSLRLLGGLGCRTWVEQAKYKPHPPFFATTGW